MKKNKKNFFTRYENGHKAIGIIFCVLFWDIFAKVITDGLSVEVWPGFFNFVSVHNTGGAWSILNQHTWLLIVLTFIFLVVFLIFNYFFKQKTMLYVIGFSLVFGGAIGNLIDRLFLGYVRDFISLDFISNFPVFNIADMCLCAGVIILCVFFLFVTPQLNKKTIKLNKNFKISKAIKLYKKGSL